MTFATCLARLEAEGTIDAERAARFRTEYDRLNAAYGKSMGAMDASMQAGKDTMDALDWQAQLDRRQKLRQIETQRQILTGLGAHIERGGKAGQYVMALADHNEAVPGVANLKNRHSSLRMLAWSKMDKSIERYKRNLLGVVSNRAELQDVARAMRGEAVDNANAKMIATAMTDTFEWLRLQYNRAGGDIPKLKNWGMPQSHDAMLIAKAGQQEWKAFIRPLVDPAQMIDNTTGKAFSDEAAIDEALDAVWRNISSQGMDGHVPGSFNGQGKLANRRTDHRFLVFKDTDAWLAYNEKFGSGDLFGAITGHIDGMTRDIAAMQILGPNPALTVRWLGDIIKMDAMPPLAGGGAPSFGKWDRRGVKMLDYMYKNYMGELTAPDPANRTFARTMQGIRNWNVTSKLGSAWVSAFFTDPFWTAINAKFNGLSATKALTNYVRTFNPADATHRAAAEHAGLVVSEMTQRAENMFREGSRMRFNLYEFSSRMADGTLRATFLTPHTVAMKQAAGVSFMKEWADEAGNAFAQLGEGKRLSFQRYGIDASDWDLLRATAMDDVDGPKLLRPGDLARREDIDPDVALAAAMKFNDLIDAETAYFVPSESLRYSTEIMTLGGAGVFEKGTVGGEVLYSMTQFKTFPVIALMQMLQRAIYGRGAMSGMQYAISLPILLTFGGILAEQLLQIRDGKDPLPMDERLVARGMLRGGGTGILGDFIGSSIQNDRGTTVAGFIGGPTLSTLVDPAINLTLGNIGEVARDEETNGGRELMRSFKANLPGGNAWYAKLAMNRLFLEELDALADPDTRAAHRRMEKRAEEQGTEFWWAPGEQTPDRAPQLNPVFSADEEGGFEP
jgi:hypothetical protein